MKKKKNLISELRQDVVSGEWVVIATGRAKRPHDFLREKRAPFLQARSGCPFERLHPDALSVYSCDGASQRENWWVEVIPNKYPAFGRGVCSLSRRSGPYQWSDGVGAHEIVVTRDHERSIAKMSDKEAELVIRSYQDRYLALKVDECAEYIAIFHNHGRQSGATLTHPHSQIIAIPVIPPDVGRSLRGSATYFHKNKSCVHCAILRYEVRSRDRIIYENDSFVVLAPFASKTAFETRIFPKKHAPYFESMSHAERLGLANALRTALAKLFKGLKNPDYNFFLHTAPTGDAKEFHHYHWHFEILPKTAIWAGFEIGTGIEISSIAPESAAEFLRKIKL